MYAQHNLIVNVLPSQVKNNSNVPHNLEFLPISVKHKNFKVGIALFYKPPSAPSLIYDALLKLWEIWILPSFVISEILISAIMILHTICIQKFVTFPIFKTWHRLWPVVLILAHMVTLHLLTLLLCPHHANFWTVVLSLPLLILITMVSRSGQIGSQMHNHLDQARTTGHYVHADFDKARDLIHNTEWDTICTSDDVDSC